MSSLKHLVKFYRKRSDLAEVRFGVLKCLIGYSAILISFGLRREGFLDTQSFPLAEKSFSLLNSELLYIFGVDFFITLHPSYCLLLAGGAVLL